MATQGKKTNVQPAKGEQQAQALQVVLLHPVRLSGEDYAVGAVLELPEADATDLVAAGFGRWPDGGQGAQ